MNEGYILNNDTTNSPFNNTSYNSNYESTHSQQVDNEDVNDEALYELSNEQSQEQSHELPHTQHASKGSHIQVINDCNKPINNLTEDPVEETLRSVDMNKYMTVDELSNEEERYCNDESIKARHRYKLSEILFKSNQTSINESMKSMRFSDAQIQSKILEGKYNVYGQIPEQNTSELAQYTSSHPPEIRDINRRTSNDQRQSINNEQSESEE